MLQGPAGVAKCAFHLCWWIPKVRMEGPRWLRTDQMHKVLPAPFTSPFTPRIWFSALPLLLGMVHANKVDNIYAHFSPARRFWLYDSVAVTEESRQYVCFCSLIFSSIEEFVLSSKGWCKWVHMHKAFAVLFCVCFYLHSFPASLWLDLSELIHRTSFFSPPVT